MVKRHKLLIIDDDPDFASATKRVLEGSYYVSCACNGREGWEKLKGDKPDLIILDVSTDKRGEGFIFSTELRKERSFHDIPVLMLTGMRQQKGSFFAKHGPRDPKFLPADVFMEKSVSPTELLINIDNLLRRRDSLREQESSRGQENTPRPKLILIVEPDKIIADEYRSIFAEQGYGVEVASTVTEAVKQVKNVKFNCIIMDVDLPDMAGYDAVSVIKTIEPEINIIITAAKNTMELEARVRKEDIFYYYIKSFDREELTLAARNALKNVHNRG